MNKIELARLDQVGRGATLKVTASNATAKSKAGADYVCDGVADEVEINAAIESLDGIGGSIELSEGTFNILDYFLINKSNITLKGQGKSTIISGTTTYPFRIDITATGVIIKDLVSQGGGYGIASNGEVILQNCVFNGTTQGVSNSGTMKLYGNTINKLRIAATAVVYPPTTELLQALNAITTVVFE